MYSDIPSVGAKRRLLWSIIGEDDDMGNFEGDVSRLIFGGKKSSVFETFEDFVRYLFLGGPGKVEEDDCFSVVCVVDIGVFSS